MAARSNLAIVSVVGRDQKGVVARVSTYLAGCNINIEDIEQRVMEGLFIMTMRVDLVDLAAGLLNGDLVVALSNHAVLRPIAERAGIPFHAFPSTDKQAHEAFLLE